MKDLTNKFMRKIYVMEGDERTPIDCDKLFFEIEPEKRLEVIPHLNEDSIVFRAENINEQDKKIDDRYAGLNVSLMCSNKIMLVVNSFDQRLGETFINIPRPGYPKLYFVKGNKKIAIPSSSLSPNKIVIQYDHGSELIIEYYVGWEHFILQSSCLKNETANDKFARLVLNPGACNVLDVKIIAYSSSPSKQCMIN